MGTNLYTMGDYVHFDGDPAVDSRRRHLERVLKGHPPRRTWPWILAAVAGGGLWAFWRAGRPRDDGPGPAGSGPSDPGHAPAKDTPRKGLRTE